MAELGREVDYAEYALEFRASTYEDFFAHPELALVICHRRKSNREALVALAVAGHNRAHQSLCGMARFLTDIGDRLPQWLQEYVVSAAERPQRPKKPGRDPLMNLLRDNIIWQAVSMVADAYRVRPTRNAISRSGASACSIVAQALARLGIHMTEANVTAIWRQARKDDLLYRRYKRRQALDALQTARTFALAVRDRTLTSDDIQQHQAILEDAQQFWGREYQLMLGSAS